MKNIQKIMLRESCDADLAAISAIYAYSVLNETASWEEAPPALAEMQRRRAAILVSGYPYIVAEVEGHVVGYAYASSYRARIGYRFTVEDSVWALSETGAASTARAAQPARKIGRIFENSVVVCYLTKDTSGPPKGSSAHPTQLAPRRFVP